MRIGHLKGVKAGLGTLGGKLRLVYEMLNDEPEPAASRRRCIENVDFVGKGSRSGSDGNEPVARGYGVQDESRTG